MLRRMLALAALVLAAALACGGKGADAPGAKIDLDSDPLALLPSAAIVIANLDARAMFDSAAVGAPAKALAETFVPIGGDAGFVASRDVDRVVVGGYGTTGADVVAIVSGRFDADRIAAATRSRSGAPLVKGTYTGRTTSTAGLIMFTALTPKTVVAGTGDGVRRVLERVADGKFDKWMPPWITDTLSTPGAELAVVADFASHPGLTVGAADMKLPWLSGMRAARVIGNFEYRPSGAASGAGAGMNVAATLTYGEPGEAQRAAQGIQVVDRWLTVLGPFFGGLELRDLQVTTQESDMRCKFALDEHAMHALLSFVPQLVPKAQ